MANGKILCLSSALLFLLSGHPQACAFQVTRQPKNKMQNSQLYQVKLNTDPQKSKSLQIEEAAGQKESEKTANMGSVSGQMAEIPAECKCYTDCPLLTNDPKVRDQLKKITETRPYPWFIAEKMATYLVDDIWSAPTRGHTSPTTFVNGAQQVKEKIVILGAGWGSAAVLRGIDTERYDVTIISPRNYFVFTPMLAGAAVGTVDVRSITQPIRAFNSDANYLEAAAKEIDLENQVVKCSGLAGNSAVDGVSSDDISDFDVPYDRLIVSVGARINTFGIPGVEEYCDYLKQIEHARHIRKKVVTNFEKANLPGTSEEEIKKLLTFCIIGAGPTGVEFSSELRDFIEQEGPKYYKPLLKYVSIKLIEATPVVLRPFDKKLQDKAVEILTQKSDNSGLFSENLNELILNKKVSEVTENHIALEDGRNIPYGLAVWAGGIGPLPLTLDIIEKVGGRQKVNQNVARGKLAVDPWLRVIDGQGKIFALGDCACNQGGPLPATAQVAAQQGEFLAHTLNAGNHTIDFVNGVQLPPKKLKDKAKLADAIASLAIQDDEYLAPFQYLDMGVLAYTGSYSALAQIQLTPSEATRMKASGSIGFGLWRSLYLAKQTSVRNQMLVFLDWFKARAFGRDITLID